MQDEKPTPAKHLLFNLLKLLFLLVVYLLGYEPIPCIQCYEKIVISTIKPQIIVQPKHRDVFSNQQEANKSDHDHPWHCPLKPKVKSKINITKTFLLELSLGDRHRDLSTWTKRSSVQYLNSQRD